MKTKTKKTKKIILKSIRRNRQTTSSAILRLRYKFLILFGVLVLAGITIVLRLETPVVWTFLYGIGGWAALTTNPGSPLR